MGFPRWRRRFTATAGALLLLAVLGVGLVLRGRAAAPDAGWRRLVSEVAPGGLDVILVTVDTLRADRLSCYGGQRLATPGFDALAAQGARFANAASTVPFTLPAHSSIMTGTYPPHHGVRENVGYHLGDGLPTLAELLRAAGWATGGFVSAFVLDSRWGIGRGFDRYFDDFRLPESGGGNLGAVQRDGKETLAHALAWLDEGHASPVLLWLHLYDPHEPYEPPEPFRSRFAGRPYDGEVAYADSLLAELTAALDRRGLLERSLVVVTADHGEGLGDHGERFHGFFVYDSTVRVPLIVRAPRGAFAGRVIRQAVSHVDLLPTVLDAVGLPPPADLQGQSLLPLLLGGREDAERGVYSESLYPLLHYGWAPLRSLRTGKLKLIAAPRRELYDLESPEGERQDLAARDPADADRLAARLATMTAAIERPGAAAGSTIELDPEGERQLRALGYLAGRGEAAATSTPAAGDAERADPKDKIALHQLVMAAQSDLGQGDEAAAAAKLAEVLAADPTILDAHQMLGTLATQQGDLEAAAGHFQRALELAPDHRASLFGLAGVYRQLGRTEDALAGYRRLLDLDPGDSRAVVAAVEILVGQGARAAAVALLDGATRGDQAPAPLLVQLGELLVLEGRKGDAEQAFRRAMARQDDLPQPRFDLAVLREEAGDLDAAMALYEQTLERAPRHFEAQFNLGRLYGARGDADRQQELWQAAIESNPDFVRGHFYLAKLLMDRGGDLARAEELTRAGLARDGQHATGPLGYYLLADLLNRRGLRAEAGRAVEQARRLQASAAPPGREPGSER